MGLTDRTITETFEPGSEGADVYFYLLQSISSGGETVRAGLIKGKVDSSRQLKAENGTSDFTLPCYDDGTTTARFSVQLVKTQSPTFISSSRKTFYMTSGGATTLSALLASGQVANPETVGQIVDAKLPLAIKSADETYNLATLQDDADLSIDLEIGTYKINCSLMVTLTPSELMQYGGFSCKLNGGDAVVSEVNGVAHVHTASGKSSILFTSLSQGIGSASNVINVEIDVYVKVTSAGSLTLSWGAFSETVESTTTLVRGSSMGGIKI